MRNLRCECLEDRANPTTLSPAFIPDPTFGTNGRAFVDSGIRPLSSTFADAAVGADGKVWVLGTVANNSVLARFTADGTLDPPFDHDGILPIPPWDESVTQLTISRFALQPDGKAIVVGQTGGPIFTGGDVIPPPSPSTGFVVMRLNADGSLDTSFGNGGRVVVDVDGSGNGFFTAQDVAVLADGRVVFGGTVFPTYGVYPPDPAAPQPGYAVVRLTADGGLDPTYGSGGIATFPSTFHDAGGTDHPSTSLLDMAVSPDGSATVLGVLTVDYATATATVRRLNPAGQFDTAFDGDGYAEVPLGTATLLFTPSNPLLSAVSSLYANAGWVEASPADGSVVIAAAVRVSQSEDQPVARYAYRNDLIAVRLSATGAVDPGFGTADTLRQTYSASDSLTTPTPPYSYSTLTQFQRLADGSFAAPVYTYTYGSGGSPSSSATTAVRFDDHGRPLAGASGGNVFAFPANAPTGQNVQPKALFLDRQGRLLAAGVSDASTVTGTRLGVARLVATPPVTNEREQTLLESRGNGEVRVVQVVGANPPVIGDPFKPFDFYSGNVQGTLADLNGDGLLDEVYAAGSESALLSSIQVRFRNADGTSQTFGTVAFEESFRGGAAIATGDLDGDGRAEIVVTAGNGGGGRVQVYSVSRTGFIKRADFFGIDDPAFRGGATAAIADLDGDGRPELLVAAGVGGGPRVAVFAGKTLLSQAEGAAPPKLMNDFFAFGGDDAGRLRNGVNVAVADLNRDGRDDLIFGAGSGGARRVLGVDGAQLLAGRVVPLVNFFVGNDAAARDGVRVSIKDVNQDRAPDVVVEQQLGVRIYDGRQLGSGLGQEPTVLRDVQVFTDDFTPIPVD